MTSSAVADEPEGHTSLKLPARDVSPPPGVEERALLEVRDLCVAFTERGRRVQVVDNLNFTIPLGHPLAVIGESGSGKTVTFRAIMGLLPATATVTGSARFEGTNLIGLSEKQLRKHRGADFAMVFQDPTRSLNPTMRIGAQITEAIRAHLPLSGKQARARAVELLEMVRLPSARTRVMEFPHQLSGGMRQRVMIAMALACEPKLLIADEATTSLDVTTQALIMELLIDLQRHLNMTLVLISHDLGLAASYSDEVIVMYAGRIVEQADTRDLFANVRMPYTEVLLNAIPSLDDPSHTLFPTVAGQPPLSSGQGTSCVFQPRCSYAQPLCSEKAPPLIADSDGHRYACWFPLGREKEPTP